MCVVQFPFEDNVINSKLYFKANSDYTATIVHGFFALDSARIFNNFDELHLNHPQGKSLLTVERNTTTTYGLIHPTEINLDPDILLGNRLIINLGSEDDIYLYAQCDVVLQDPSFNQTEIIIL